MALGKKPLAPQKTRSLEELANLADAWADMCDKHKFSGDTRQFVDTAGRQLREKAASIRALLLLKVKHEI